MKNLLCLVLALLCGIANASKAPDFKRIGANPTGNSVTLGPTGSPANGGPSNWSTAIPIPAAPSSWTPAGNYGAASGVASGPTMNMSASGDVFFSGTKYPFQAAYAVPKSAIVTAVVGVSSLLGGWPGIIAAGAAPFLLDWITQSGGRVNSTTGQLERTDPAVCTVAPCFEYNITPQFGGGPSPWFSSISQVCSWYASNATARGQTMSNCTTYNGISPYNGVAYGQTISGAGDLGLKRSAAPAAANWLPASMDDIAPYMQNKPYDSKVIQEILDRGADIQMPQPTVTGPSTIPGPSTTTINPDGSRTVTNLTKNFGNSGPTITNTSNVTTTTTYNTDNSVRSVSNTTVTPDAADKPENPCDKTPDAAGCQKLGDAPDKEKIPTQEIPVTSTPTTFGSASGCPTPYSGTISVLTFTKSWSITFTPMCDLMTTLRPLFLALGAAAAAWLFMEGLKA